MATKKTVDTEPSPYEGQKFKLSDKGEHEVRRVEKGGGSEKTAAAAILRSLSNGKTKTYAELQKATDDAKDLDNALDLFIEKDLLA